MDREGLSTDCVKTKKSFRTKANNGIWYNIEIGIKGLDKMDRYINAKMVYSFKFVHPTV
jgi:hypothetical protein